MRGLGERRVMSRRPRSDYAEKETRMHASIPSSSFDAQTEPRIESLSAITLATRDMPRAVAFYDALGFPMKYGGPQEAFTSFAFGGAYLNLIVDTRAPVNWWGRVIFYVSDVDALYRKALAASLRPSLEPSDAPWGERYFHITDPDGHELSFARPLR